jgi:Zn-finger nucleic acid-binding protein
LCSHPVWDGLKEMDCPSCSGKLRRIKAKSHILDICPSCKGLWFGPGELAVFVRELVEEDEIQPEKLCLFQPREVHVPDPVEAKDRLCPHCRLVMTRYNYCYDSNVFLDKCPRCHGIWTDRGEISRIARYLKQDTASEEIGRDLVRQNERLVRMNELSQLGEDLTSHAGIGMLFMPRLILPLSDNEERRRFPVITVALIALCISVFVAEIFWIKDMGQFIRRYGFVPGDFSSVGLVTSMFLHAGRCI